MGTPNTSCPHGKRRVNERPRLPRNNHACMLPNFNFSCRGPIRCFRSVRPGTRVLRRRFQDFGKIYQIQIDTRAFWMRCHEDFGFDRPRFSPYYCAPMTDTGNSDRSASPVGGTSSPLPLYTDIRKAFDLESVFEGSCSLERLPRFADCLASPDGEVSGKLRFGLTGTGRRVIPGSVSATVEGQMRSSISAARNRLAPTLDASLSVALVD